MIFGSRVLRFSACLLLLGLVACDKGPSAPSSQARPAASGMVASAAPATHSPAIRCARPRLSAGASSAGWRRNRASFDTVHIPRGGYSIRRP